jgi:hypothetical protein
MYGMRWFYEMGDRWRLWKYSKYEFISIHVHIRFYWRQGIIRMAVMPAVLARSPRGNLEYLRWPGVALRIVHSSVCKCIPPPFWYLEPWELRLNMELDLHSLFVLLYTAVLIGWDPATPPPPHTGNMRQKPGSSPLRGEAPPPPPSLGSSTRALLVSHDRRHLLVTPCLRVT